MEVTHHIPVTIDQQSLDSALEIAQRKDRWKTNTLPSSYSNTKSQEGYPELEFPGGVEYLHGCHRVQAGKEHLPPSKQWWIVDVYLPNISYELRTFLIEEYANEKMPCDGVIFRKIIEYQTLPSGCMVSSSTCHSLEQRWWARLKGKRKAYLKGILGVPRLRPVLEFLSKITGLCDSGMRITTLHKVKAMRCHDVSMLPGISAHSAYMTVDSKLP